VVSSRKKDRNLKRESKLHERVVSGRFVAAWAFHDESYGLFFALSSKSANTVLRNRIKRVFREITRKNIFSFLDKGQKEKMSLCLISKKGVKFSEFDQSLRDELERISSYIVERIR